MSKAFRRKSKLAPEQESQVRLTGREARYFISFSSSISCLQAQDRRGHAKMQKYPSKKLYAVFARNYRSTIHSNQVFGVAWERQSGDWRSQVLLARMARSPPSRLADVSTPRSAASCPWRFRTCPQNLSIYPMHWPGKPIAPRQASSPFTRRRADLRAASCGATASS